MVTKLERENNTIFYLHNAWANSPDGTAGFTLEESEDAAYIGNCISMSSAEVLNPSSYNWIAVEFEAVEESDTAELTELGEDVPEDPEDEDDDYSYEDYMDGAVQSAADTATTAQESADIAQQKAEEATASAALAKQKAEEATSSAALAKQKAESATAAAETAHSAAQSATSDARTAGIAAATAQAAAEAAQGDIDDQKKYFYHDRLGAHVLDAAGGAYRTDIKSDGVQIVQTATETPIAKYGETSTIGATAGNHITIAEKDVQIRNGKKTVASYGQNTRIGPEDGNHFVISPDAIKAKNGDIEILKIIFETAASSKTATTAFHGEDVANEILNGNTYIVNLRLGEKATEITEVLLYNSYASTEDPDMVIDNTKSWIHYEYNNTLAEVNLTIEGSYDDAKAISWNKYIALKVRYTPLKKYDSTVTCDNLTASGELTVKRDLTATNAIIDGSLNVSDITLFNRKSGSIAYYDQSGSWADLIRIREGTGTAKATTGRVTTQPNWWRCGNLVQLEFGVAATAAVNPGKNIATGTITGIPRPVTTNGLRAVSYYGNNANVTLVSKDGAFTVRNCGSDALAKGNDAIGIFTYITDGTFTGGSSTGGQPGGGA